MAQLKFQTQRNLVIDMTDPSKYWSLKELSRRSRLESYPLNPLNCPVQLPKRWTGAIRMKRCNKTRSDFFRVFFPQLSWDGTTRKKMFRRKSHQNQLKYSPEPQKNHSSASLNRPFLSYLILNFTL